jgi:hypothetical protein
MTDPRFNLRLSLIGGLVVAGLVAMLCSAPIPQDQAYHHFADERAFLSMPNFGNVASNFPFIAVGAWGLWEILARRRGVFRERWERAAWAILFGSVFAVGFGSSYYHWRPCDETLFWDRLPMTTLFTSFLAIGIGERVRSGWGARMLVPLLAAGVGTLLYWRHADDLRWYGLLQGLAMAAIPAMLLLFRPSYTRSRDWWAMVALYAAAKLCEVGDHAIDGALGNLVSGHTIKHLLASLAAWRGVVMVLKREPMGETATAPLPAAPQAAA